jgi:aspartate dehydrogenase
VVGALVSMPRSTRPASPESYDDVNDLLQLLPDVVVEAAGHAAVRSHAGAVLEAGVDLMLLSVGVLADPALHNELTATAERTGARLLIPSGAVGGLDALAAARATGLYQVMHTIRKPPAALGFSEDIEPRELVVAEGTARAIALEYPANANVVAAIGFAGLGLDETQVRVIADSSLSRNVHEIQARGAFGEFQLRVVNEPLAANPRSSALAAGSVAAALLRRSATFAIA